MKFIFSKLRAIDIDGEDTCTDKQFISQMMPCRTDQNKMFYVFIPLDRQGLEYKCPLEAW